MASVDASDALCVCLPLSLLTDPGGERITEDGLRDIAKDLKQNLKLLQQHIRENKDLAFVSIVDVSFENGQVDLTFEIKSESHLDSLYKCLWTEDNALSKCMSTYFMDKSLEMIADLELYTKITCQVWMSRSVFHKCSAHLCEMEEETRNNNTEKDKDEMTGSNSKMPPSSGSVQQRVQKINQRATQGYTDEQAACTSNARPAKETGSNPSSPGTVPDVSRQQGDSSALNKAIKTEGQMLTSDIGIKPGSYPYRSKDVSNTETTQAVRRSFILFYPVLKNWKVHKMLIESDCSYLNAEMKVHSGVNLFEYSANIPVDQLNFPYQYVCHSKYSYFGFMGKSTTERSRKLRIGDFHIQRDSWITQGYRISDVCKFDEDCLSVHLADLLFHCPENFSINEICKQIENVCFASKLPRKNAMDVLQTLAICLSSGSDATRLLFAVTIGNVLTHPERLFQEKIIDAATATIILTSLRKYKIEHLPKFCRESMYSVCLYLCQLLLGKSMHLIQYLNMCYPFYDEPFLIRRLQDSIESRVRIVSDDDSMFGCAYELCYNLYRASIQDLSVNAKKALDILLRQLPLRMTLFVFSKMGNCSKDVSVQESDLQNLLYSVVTIRIESNLTAIKKSRNVEQLRILWKNISDVDKTNESLKPKFEDALTSILESYPSATSEPLADIVIDFVLQLGFYKDENAKKKLLDIVMESQSQKINELFIVLANCQGMASQYLVLEKERFQTFCLKYVTGMSNFYHSREDDLQYLLKRVCRIWDVTVVRKKTEFNDALVNVLQRELDKYRPRQLLKHLKSFDDMAESNENIVSVFIGYMKSILEEKTETPYEIMRHIPAYHGIHVVSTRLMAKLVCALLDVCGALPEESTVFENFFKLVTNYEFWILVFECKGEFVDIVKRNDNYKRALECIAIMENLFRSNEVHYDFVRKMDKTFQYSSSAKKLLEMKCSRNEVEQFWLKALSRFKEFKETLLIARDVMDQVKQRSPNLPSGFNEALKQIQDCEGRLASGTIKLSECVKDAHFWKGLEKLPTICKYLKNVVNSSVFWNISSEYVYEEYLRKFEEAEDDDPLRSLCTLFQEMTVAETKYSNSEGSFMLYMDLLQKIGHFNYGDMWRKLLNSDEFRMVEVLKMFGSAPDILKEVEIAKTYLHVPIDGEIEECLVRIFSSDTVKSTVDAMESVVTVFGLDWKKDEIFATSITSFRQILLGAAEEFTFAEVKLAMNTVFSLVRNMSEDTVNTMIALGRASTLITFLKTIVDEDIKNLIDAVEDISEQQVRESTVSALIEVKQYLHPLLLHTEKNCVEFLNALEKQTKSTRTSSATLPHKIEDCIQNLHNLKSLYNGVANRGEQTKEMIKNITQKGSYLFHLNRACSGTTFEASYKQNKAKEIRKRSTLIDLRSRALLLMNSERESINEARFNREELLKFVGNIDLCLDISELLFALYSSGHIGYMMIKETIKPDELPERKEALKLTFQSWLCDINDERERHYLMNFIQGNQIHTLYKHLEESSGDINIVQTILKFIHPEMRALHLQEFYQKEKLMCEGWSNRQMLHCIGFALHSSFAGLVMFQRPVELQRIKTLSCIVQPSRLTVAQLDEGSLHTVRTVLALYLNTTQRLPEPNHIVFCTRETTWTELELLIRRSLGACEFYRMKVLFCIANVEMLPNEIQFSLVETLRHLDKETKFLLAVICRGSRSHPFIDELSDCVTSINPVTDKTVRDIFKEHCKNVVTVTSKFSGLGKTSYITSMAHKRQKGVVTLHVSGSVRKSHLVDRINLLHVKPFHVLHIDLGNVDSPSELDTFLFELVVLRYVTAGYISVSLQTSDVFIEIANTINDTLRNALQTAVLFQRIKLEWNGLEDIMISHEINSPVQVVCHYLKYLENGSLDRKDLFIDSASQKSLSAKQCKSLLHKHLGGKLSSSFPVLFTFINVLADQLKKMSHSSFFKVNRLIDMIGNKVELTVKSSLVEAMIEVSSDFATRSVEDCRESQISTVVTEEKYQNDLADSVTSRVDSMIRWEDSNHLMFVFHNQNIHTVSALYRNLTKVPSEIRNLFESQMKKKMEDFNEMDQEKLQSVLQKVARSNPLPLQKKNLTQLSKDYALTADNLLKMVLIMLRIKANIPVVIMGETGCGKTSLVRYLAGICEVQFDVMNIHAGVKEDDIVDRVSTNNERASLEINKDRWLFLDEINTSDSIGLISDIICHHRCLGKELSPNLIIMGACNPYKLRSTKAISTAGLEGKAKSDELSRLVYRVLPLPEMMVDYVWDFGSLNEKDEETYIYRMTIDVFPFNGKHHDLFKSLLSVSQAFVRRKEEASYSVSLRDVQRCKLLTKWFLTILPKKRLLKSAISSTCHFDIKSMILSLAHCYQSRFSDKTLRKEYRSVIGDTFKLHGYQFPDDQEHFIQTVIKDEQSDILRRMKLPPGTARNTALQENVFVILVCIFNRIPIFVVGKPGCSKSLAMQLIKSNLRGKDSEDDFFKELPQLYCVSFQGSESSTSDGIIKVFAKAEKYQESNNIEEVLSVVILDEIGLAEVSRFNPLKVLHNLLEPEGQSQPNVAVVGISNWALDASKMNRAIHLSRTDMDEDELYDTAISISESFLGKEKERSLFHKPVDKSNSISLNDIQGELQGMATAYFQYIDQLRFKHFHGLRDYYSLIKFVARTFVIEGSRRSEERKAEIITDGIARNFGGLPDEMQTLYDVFQRQIPLVMSKDKPLIELVTENIKDPIARHLMLITTGESVLGIIEQKLKEIGCDRKEVIFGSQFEEDLTDDYNYRILSRIILCMEEGMVLILKDLESVYGSLYDMLNQNYTIIGKKKNCRVALGPYSNPICHVADSFRCIVLTDERKLDLTDPPFLNRFEKQYLRFFDIIEEKHLHVIRKLDDWIVGLSDTSDGRIEKEEMFPIYNKDLAASLVLKAGSESAWEWQTSDSEGSVLTECKQKLLWIIKPEVIIRQKMSNNSSIQSTSDELIRQYFSLPIHQGLGYFISEQIDNNQSEEPCYGLLTVLFTNSNVHTKVVMPSNRFKTQTEKLGAFKSEKQLSSRIQHFWETGESSILIVQCNAKDDEKHILLTKLVIERYRNKYILQVANAPKHVYLVIHLDRSKAASHSVSQLNFLSDWKLVMMDSLEYPVIALPALCKMTLQEAIFAKTPLNAYIKEELYWAFSRIRYGTYGRDVSSISSVISKIEGSPDLMEIFENEILSYIRRQCSGRYDKYWQLEVARDITALTSSASFIDALEKFILGKIKTPLAKLMYRIEQTGVLESFLPKNSSGNGSGDKRCQSKRTVWISAVHDERFFSIDGVPDETGPECYTCETADYALSMPFSKFIFDSIEATKNDFMETVKLYRLRCFLNEDEELPSEVYDEILLQQENCIVKKIPELNDFTYETWKDDYLQDFCSISAQTVFASAVRKDQKEITELVLERLGVIFHEDPFVFLIRLHTSFWVKFETARAQMVLIDRCISVIPESKVEIFKVLSGVKKKVYLKTSRYFDDLEENISPTSHSEGNALEGTFPDIALRTEASETMKLYATEMELSVLDDFEITSNLNETNVAEKILTIDKNHDYARLASVNEFNETGEVTDLQLTEEQQCLIMTTSEDYDNLCTEDTLLVRSEVSCDEISVTGKLQADKSDEEMVLSNECSQTQNAYTEMAEPDTHDVVVTMQENDDKESSEDINSGETLIERKQQMTNLERIHTHEQYPYLADDDLADVPILHSNARCEMDVNHFVESCNINEEETSSKKVGANEEQAKFLTTEEEICLENAREDIDTWCDILVYTVCKVMLPTTECLKKHRGIKHWLEEVNSTVSLAAQVSRSPKLLYSLRVCTELAAGLIIPLHLDENLLECVGNTMGNGSALDSEQVFCTIENMFQSALSSASSSSYSADVNKICQRAISSYIYRCISADPETTAFRFLFKLVLESNIPRDFIIWFKVPISTFLQLIDREMFTDTVSKDLLNDFEINSKSSEEYDTDSTSEDSGLQFLQSLDTCLNVLLEDKRIDEPFLVLLADCLQDIYMDYFFQSTPNMAKDISRQESEVGIDQQSVELLYVCHKTMKEPKSGLKYIASVAFCQSFVYQAAALLKSADSGVSSRILSILDVVLSDLPGEETHYLTILFLKELLSTWTFRRIQKYCVTNEEKYTFIRCLNMKNRALKTHFEKSPLCIHITESVHKANCFQYKDTEIEEYKARIESMVKHSKNDVYTMLQFFSFVLRDFYLQLSESDLDDTGRTQAELILNEIVGSEISAEGRIFTKCILGEDNFRTKDFILTDASSTTHVCKASLLTCFYAMLLAHYELCADTDSISPVFIKCLVYPEQIKSCYIPGFLSSCAKNLENDTNAPNGGFDRCLGLCKCGNRMSFKDDSSPFFCPLCGQNVKTKIISPKEEFVPTVAQGNNLDVKTSQISNKLNPVTAHLLQFLVKGCLLGSLSLSFVSENALEKMLMITDVDAGSCLSDGVDLHWQTLKSLLNVSDNSLAVLMHVIFLKANNKLFYSTCSFKTGEETLDWEEAFDKLVCSVLESRFSHIGTVYQHHNRIHNMNQNCMENRMFEIEDFSIMNTENKLLYLPALYRSKAKSNKTNFYFELHAHRNEYPLLAKTLEHQEDLQLPKHILTLIQWHTATVANASYMLKSSDCTKMTAQDFIYFKQDSMKKDVMKLRFEAFRKSWDELRGMLCDHDIASAMIRIHSQSKLADCLILNEESVPFRVLQTLIGIQNSFLDQVLLIAGKCDALKWLESKGTHTIPCVNITALKKEDLIHFDLDWNALLEQESHCNLAYGCGQQIHYDFHSIENAVSLEVITGKSYIVAETLPDIVFIDELHKNYASLIKELRIGTAQELLPAEISNGIKSRKAEDPRMATELLTHLGIVMTILKKTGGDPDQSLVDFVDKWKSILCRHFPKILLPNPEGSVKLSHVVALSELLEELSADSVKEGLGDEYRDKLDGPIYDHLIVQLKDDTLSSILFKAVKRFTYRCLASRTADPKQSLRLYLSDESFWPIDSFQHDTLHIGGSQIFLSDVLPDGLMVRHIFYCFELMEQEIETRRQGNLKLSGFATSFQAKSKATPTKYTHKKKKTIAKRKF